MKKLIITMLAAVCILLCAGCNCSGRNEENEPMNETPKLTITTLEGNWKGRAENVRDDDWYTYYLATISNDTIIITKVDEQSWGTEEIIFWYGTYKNPEDPVSTYSWESSGNKDNIDSNGLHNSKVTFTYADGKISFLYSPDQDHEFTLNPLIYLEKIKK